MSQNTITDQTRKNIFEDEIIIKKFNLNNLTES